MGVCIADGCARDVLAKGLCPRHYQEWRLTNKPTCSIESCDRPQTARGYCNLHYLRHRLHGDAEYQRQPRLCSVQGCDRPHMAHGYCQNHWRHWRQYGDPMRYFEYAGPCVVEGCGRPHKGHGYCNKHYQRFRDHGDASVVLKKGQKPIYDPPATKPKDSKQMSRTLKRALPVPRYRPDLKRYEIRPYITDVTGRKQRPSVYGKTIDELKERLDALVVESRTNGLPAGNRTVREAFEDWLEYTVKPGPNQQKDKPLYSQGSYILYKGHVERHLLQPVCGIADMKVRDLKKPQVRMMVTRLSRTICKGTKDTYSWHQIGMLLQIGKACWATLLEDGTVVGVNPFDGIKIPRHETRELRYEDLLTGGRDKPYRDAIIGHRFEVCFRLLFDFGLRASEAIGFKCDSVVFTSHQLRIDGQMDRSGFWKPWTKSSNGRRSLPMWPDAEAYLRRHIAAEKLKARNHRMDGYLVTDVGPDQKPLTYGQLYQAWKLLLREKGLPHKNPHILRATCLSEMSNAGADDLTIMKWAGHATIAAAVKSYIRRPDASRNDAWWQRMNQRREGTA